MSFWSLWGHAISLEPPKTKLIYTVVSLLYVATLGVTTSAHLMKGGSPIIFSRNMDLITIKQLTNTKWKRYHWRTIRTVASISAHIRPCIYSGNLGILYIFFYFESIFSIKSGWQINLLDYISVSVLVFPSSIIILSADCKKRYSGAGDWWGIELSCNSAHTLA